MTNDIMLANTTWNQMDTEDDVWYGIFTQQYLFQDPRSLEDAFFHYCELARAKREAPLSFEAFTKIAERYRWEQRASLYDSYFSGTKQGKLQIRHRRMAQLQSESLERTTELISTLLKGFLNKAKQEPELFTTNDLKNLMEVQARLMANTQLSEAGGVERTATLTRLEISQRSSDISYNQMPDLETALKDAEKSIIIDP